MFKLQIIALLTPFFTTGCIVYDERNDNNKWETGNHQEDFDRTQTTTVSEGDALAWLEPSFALLGSTEIVGLYGNFDAEEVESISLTGPGEIDILASTIRDDEYLITIDLSHKSTKAGSYDANIWFTDGTAYFVPDLFEVIPAFAE